MRWLDLNDLLGNNYQGYIIWWHPDVDIHLFVGMLLLPMSNDQLDSGVRCVNTVNVSKVNHECLRPDLIQGSQDSAWSTV